MTSALETQRLGKRYGGTWALRDCTISVPTGRVVALVGPNGAGKTTLLHLAVGLLAPSEGSVHIFGHEPYREPGAVLPAVGFVAQDHPLYRGFAVEDMIALGRHLNPHWDDESAKSRLRRKGIPLQRRVGKLSGGQQAQVALALALAKRPQLLLLDEPVASLDPMARREFLQTLEEAARGEGTTVVLSSHIIGDLERVCDYLIILSASRVELDGDITQLQREHLMLEVPRSEVARLAETGKVIDADPLGSQARILVRLNGVEPAPNPAWPVREIGLEDIVLAYLSRHARTDVGGAECVGAMEESEVTR
ncbi:MAG TPA: ABC transporter ATP-binding protein [Ktedonobacterales bacterium]|jgi:ABC-2 type transport system ATP-binding protein|nr:ABC transporter ATP-binding protein [Ktedonobacterales bacterium]